MQKIITLAVFSATMLLVSCSKQPDKVLPRKTGNWNISILYSTLSVTQKESGTISFTKNNAYTSTTTSNGDTYNDSGSWKYDKAGKKITLSSNKQDGISLTYDVLEMKSKSEKWKGTTNSLSGGDITTIDVALTK